MKWHVFNRSRTLQQNISSVLSLTPDDEDLEWEPPTAAEMKVIQARRERQDKISKLMGDYLLKGYKMLDECCDACGVSSDVFVAALATSSVAKFHRSWTRT